MHDFTKDYNKCKKVTVKLSDEKMEKIKAFAEKYKEAKKAEKDYQRDNDKIVPRCVTGRMGECALEKLFGKDFVDWEIGCSSKYNVADLKPLGLNVGVKTVEKGKYPIIRKEEPTPEIICVKTDDNTVAVCGLATQDVLSKYTDDNLILNSKLRAKGYKTGFYGFEHLKPFETFDELKALLM